MTPASEPFDQRLLDCAPDAVVVVDQARRITFSNRAAERLFGFRRAELLGEALEVLGPVRCRADYAGVLSDGAAVLGPSCPRLARELTGRDKEGREFPLEVALSRAEPGGDVILLAFRDVSAQRQAEAGLRVRARQQGLVAELGRRALTGIDLRLLMDEAVGVVRRELGAEYGNLLELLPDGSAVFQAGVGWRESLVGGLTVELRAGTPAGQVILEQVPVLIEDLRTDERFAGPSVLRDHGVVSSLNVPLYGQGRPLGVLGVHTARVRRFTPEDNHFVQAVANVVSTALERRRQEDRQREQQMLRADQMAAIGQVAAGVAHELRNPLTSIKGLVQVNLREATARGVPVEDLAVIEHEVRRMERTLQTFLDFARPSRPDRRRLDLAGVVERVYSLVGGRARKQQVSLRFLRPDEPAWVEADQDQLQQLLLNLVLNALDALAQGGTVEVALRPPRDDHVEVHVRDSGPGIAAHILPKVFETFVSSKETGVGLGLPVSRRIAEDHGGTLSAYNLPEGGACFVLRLPAPV
jgi:PAS domain S-box-containing protein